MYESFGFQTDGQGGQSISLFIPDNTVDPTQYGRGGPSRTVGVKIVGDFIGWDPAGGPAMVKEPHPNGAVWRYMFPEALPEGFYQYLYVAQFEDGTTRTVGDPCTKYGGTSLDRSAFVVGGSPIAVESIVERLPTPELRIYELMLDDFTKGFREDRAPIDAVVDKLDQLVELGINAIEFMPLTTWPDDSGFSWGYNPAYLFSVESNYVQDGGRVADRLSRLAGLVTECHSRNLHVLLDIVLQHASQGSGTNGFPYYWLWQNPAECPFIGDFSGQNTYGMLPLDYGNACTQAFVLDVCKYWLETFSLDGLRFDQVTGYEIQGLNSKGAPAVIAGLNNWLAERGEGNVSLILEDSWGYSAVADANNMNADGAWFDMFRSMPFAPFSGFLSTGQMSASYMRTLNSSYQFDFPISPVIYIENHDHSTVTYAAGGRANWAATQPYAIALATCPGAVLIHNGQEWGQEELLWENDENAPPEFKRVQPRPLDWSEAADETGQQIRSIYSRLLKLREDHPGLRSPNFYPEAYDWTNTRFDSQGYGIDVERKLVIYHRWGNERDGKLERFIVVLNFQGYDQAVDVPFPIDGTWRDLINGGAQVVVTGNKLSGWTAPSNWGCVFWIEG